MVQIDFSLKHEFSWQDFCADAHASRMSDNDGWVSLHDSTRHFMEALGLSAIHPHCRSQNFTTDSPLMGPLLIHDYHDGIWDEIITFWKRASPALLALGELWLRLFAGALAPLGIGFLLWILLGSSGNSMDSKISKIGKFQLIVASIISLASSTVLTTDTWYVYHFGPRYGMSLLIASTTFTAIVAKRYGLTAIKMFIVLTWLLTSTLSFKNGDFQFGGDELPLNVTEGLYYNSENPLIHRLVQNWPIDTRTYSPDTGATPWTPTGDARTGIPFLVNGMFPLPDLELTKVWVPTVDDEAVRLEIAFPPKGHQPNKAVYVILHGLSGGSQEEYIKDIVHRVTKQGHTAVIMIARGLMDTPIKGWNVFHGARISDIAVTATAIRSALGPGQSLVAVGYSMGAIILANYVARSGDECALDAAIAVSGALDSRFQFYNERAKRLWQPMLAITLREQFVLGKLGERYRERLNRTQMLNLMRATHITGVDEHGVVTYNGFNNVLHYYSEMSAMGDIPLDSPKSLGRIANISIPFCVVHALDDPLITWKTVVANAGLRHPSNIVQAGEGNILMLLTKAGGHVGWPLGINPSVDKWAWMSGVVQHFVNAFESAKEKETVDTSSDVP